MHGGTAWAGASSTTAHADRYGVVDSTMRHVDPQTLKTALDRLRRGGVRVVRSDMGWASVEPEAPGADGAHRYAWGAHDQWVGRLALSGLRLYPIVDYSTPWASVSGAWNSRPREPAAYAAFAAAVVQRYGADGTFWNEHPGIPRMPVESVELWNEPNTARHWIEQETAPRDYGRLYQAARNAVKSVAPRTEVVVGGLVDRGVETFIRDMVAAVPALAGQVDSVAYHGYLLRPADLIRRIRAVRATMDAAGLGDSTMSLTEVGWSSLETSDEVRGDRLAEISRLATDPGLKVVRVIAFAAMSNEGDAGAWDQWFGLLDHDASAKPTFLRWAAQIAALERSAPGRASATAQRRAAAARRARSARGHRSATRARLRRTAGRGRPRGRAGSRAATGPHATSRSSGGCGDGRGDAPPKPGCSLHP